MRYEQAQNCNISARNKKNSQYKVIRFLYACLSRWVSRRTIFIDTNNKYSRFRKW